MGLLATEESHKEAQAGGARVVGVVVNANVWRTFDYVWPRAFGEPTVGQRVRVPFGRGNRTTLAFVVDLSPAGGVRELKTVAEIVDTETQFDATRWQLGQWISRYYLTPLGMTLAAMIPSAVGRHRTRNETVVFLTSRRGDWPSSLGARQRRVLDELLEARKQHVEPLTLENLLRHSGGSKDTARRLAARELIRLESRPVRLPELAARRQIDPFELNEDQESVLAALEAKLSGAFSGTLLYGVTGSGKT